LYDQLSQASYRETAQMGGFTSLLLAWAYEYLSDRAITRREDPEYTEDRPRARRWLTSRVSHLGLQERRVMLDELTLEDIIWTPFEGHRAHRPLDERALYSGFIRTPFGGSVRRHMPERVMRQMGYIQDIPPTPPVDDLTAHLAQRADDDYAAFGLHLVPEGIPATYPGEAVAGYMRWYSRVSHPCLIPPERLDELSAVVCLNFVFSIQLRFC
jgi:hypothetical protein